MVIQKKVMAGIPGWNNFSLTQLDTGSRPLNQRTGSDRIYPLGSFANPYYLDQTIVLSTASGLPLLMCYESSLIFSLQLTLHACSDWNKPTCTKSQPPGIKQFQLHGQWAKIIRRGLWSRVLWWRAAKHCDSLAIGRFTIITMSLLTLWSVWLKLRNVNPGSFSVLLWTPFSPSASKIHLKGQLTNQDLTNQLK